MTCCGILFRDVSVCLCMCDRKKDYSVCGGFSVSLCVCVCDCERGRKVSIPGFHEWLC